MTSTLTILRAGDVSKAVRRRWINRVKNAQRQIGRLEERAVRDVLATLRRTKARILGEIVTAGSEFQQWFLPQTKAAAEQAIREYERELAEKVLKHSDEAARLGVERVGRAARSLNVTLPPVPVATAPQTLELAHQIIPEFIQAESDALIRDVGRELRMAFSGGQTREQMTARVRDMLTKKLRFKDKRHRAETIVRTEVNRTHNAAHQEEMSRLGAENVKVRKQWISAGDIRTRPEHRQLNGKIVDVDERFPYPGIPKSQWPMYPLDPALPAEASINCRCTMIELFEVIDEDEAAAVAEEVSA